MHLAEPGITVGYRFKNKIKAQQQCKSFVTQISLSIHSMHKTRIFIIQLCIMYYFRVIHRCSGKMSFPLHL